MLPGPAAWFKDKPSAVRDVTWMSALSMHLGKWVGALEQVTDSHLVKCPHQLTTWSSATQDFEVQTDFL